MEQLASLLLHSRTQAHSFHLGVKGVGALSAHLALGHYYDSIGGLVDGVSTNGGYSQDARASLTSLSTKGSLAFNAKLAIFF